MGGRHVDPDRTAFWRSLARAAGKALLVLALLAGLTALVAMFAGHTADPVTLAFPDETPEPATESPAAEPTPSTPPPTEPAEADTPPADETPPPTKAPGSTTVQVLDAGGGPDATEQVVALLEEWGYDVVAVNQGRCCYELTTLFFSDGGEQAAEALRDREGRFAVVDENPGLDEAVDLHVVVGEDWDGP